VSDTIQSMSDSHVADSQSQFALAEVAAENIGGVMWRSACAAACRYRATSCTPPLSLELPVYSIPPEIPEFPGISHYENSLREIPGIFTARCTLVQSAVLRSLVVCVSVRPSVCLWRWWMWSH